MQPSSHRRSRSLSACTAAAAFVVLPASAHAQFRLHVDGHVAAPLSDPQRNEFGLGGGAGLAAEYLPLRQLGLLVRASGLALSPFDGPLPEGFAHPQTGTLEALTFGLRARPFAGLVGGAIDELWIEIAGGAGFTGSVVRPLATARAGMGYRVGRIIAGPWFGYTRVFEVGPSLLPGDAQIISAGLEFSIAFDAAPRRPPRRITQPSRLTTGDDPRVDRTETDRDADAVPDRSDRCPDVREDMDGFEDVDGCPESDNDRDGISDVQDACPNDPETTNGVLDGDGCPDEAPVEVVQGRIESDDSIQFAFDSVRILPASDRTVHAIARVLLAHAEYATVFIEGHADEVGSDEYNDALSYRRAESVITELVRLGVPRDRMSALGFGRRHPVDIGRTASARARNRRVEFVVDGHRSTGRARIATGYVDVSEVIP